MSRGKHFTKLTSMFPYFGSKGTSGRTYPPPRPDLDRLVEPFAGSAAYAFAHWKKRVTLYDVSPKVCGIWEWLIRSSQADVLALPSLVHDVRDAGLCQEAAWLVGFWCNPGSARPKHVMTTWAKAGKGWSKAVKEAVAVNLFRIRHWQVVCKSYADAPDVEATWFVDPPYQRSGTAYEFSDVDYGHLRTWATARRGRVICCGQPGDDWADFNMRRAVRNQKADEVFELIMLRDSP